MSAVLICVEYNGGLEVVVDSDRCSAHTRAGVSPLRPVEPV